MSTSTNQGDRRLGRSGPDVSALGLGCWAIGGPFATNGRPNGWGEVDDEESVRAIRLADQTPVMSIAPFDPLDPLGVFVG